MLSSDIDNFPFSTLVLVSLRCIRREEITSKCLIFPVVLFVYSLVALDNQNVTFSVFQLKVGQVVWMNH